MVTVQDIETAFWCLRLSPAQSKQLTFFMYWEPEGGADGGGVLTAQATSTSRLEAVAVLVAIMGVSQSGLFLALVRGDVDLEDEILKFLLQHLAYVDDLHSAVLPQEIQDLQKKTFPLISWQKLSERCYDQLCCPAAGSQTAHHEGVANTVNTTLRARRCSLTCWTRSCRTSST